MRPHTVPVRYVPTGLSSSDRKKQIQMLVSSRKSYKKNKYQTRKPLQSFKSKSSNHIVHARKMYNIENISPNKELSHKTGCSIDALRKIVSKGEGAYYSSGSRPNQTAQSWGFARLASAITGGKSAAVDYDIIDKGCDHNKKAFILAKKSRRMYKFGNSKVKSKRVKLFY